MKLIAAATTLAVLMAFGVTPVLAASPGDLSVRATPATVIDRDGTVTLKIRYSCTQYEAPYNGTDLLYASIVSGTGG